MLPGGINPIWNYLFYPQQYQPFSNPIQPNYFGNNIPDTYPPLPAAQTPRPFTYTAPTQIQSNPPAETYSGGARRRDEGRVYEMKKQKKVFKKDKGCPVEGCGRKYSSRIALRAHIRRQHPRWAEETSDYEP